MVHVIVLWEKKKRNVRSGIRTHAYICRLRPERSALDRSAILTNCPTIKLEHYAIQTT